MRTSHKVKWSVWVKISDQYRTLASDGAIPNLNRKPAGLPPFFNSPLTLHWLVILTFVGAEEGTQRGQRGQRDKERDQGGELSASEEREERWQRGQPGSEDEHYRHPHLWLPASATGCCKEYDALFVFMKLHLKKKKKIFYLYLFSQGSSKSSYLCGTLCCTKHICL